MMDAVSVRYLVSLESARVSGDEHGPTARDLAYREEAGHGGAEQLAGLRRARARLYGLKSQGLVGTRVVVREGVACLAWEISHAGRKALHEALQVRCPYCGGRKGEGMPHPLGHHKMSCYATRTVEPALERAFGQGRAE